MPIIKSAKKRVKITQKATIRNAKTKRSLREALKAFSKAVSAGSSEEIARTEREAMSAIDKAAKKAVIHKNKAARHKSRLSAQAKAAGSKQIKSVKAKVTTTKKAAPKKAAAPKTTTKKSPAKKPVAKKAPAKKK